MEAMIHNDYRQQPIASDEACRHYRDYLARLESMIEDQEAVVRGARQLVMSLSLLSRAPPSGAW
jgi:hypothetical protein